MADEGKEEGTVWENVTLGDPREVIGGGKSQNGQKKFRQIKKSQEREEEPPGDKVLTYQFQTVGVVLASDWCQKAFVFFLPNQKAARVGRSRFVSTYMIYTYQPVTRHILTRLKTFHSQHRI